MKRLLLLIWLTMVSPAWGGITGWSGSNYLRRLSQVYDTNPFIISMWIRLNALGTEREFIHVGTSGQESQARGYVEVNTSNQMQARTFDGGGVGQAVTSDAVSSGAWFEGFAEFIAVNSRAISFANAHRVTDATSKTTNASDSVYIGVRADATQPVAAADCLAEFAIWDGTGMSDANRAALDAKIAAGGNPINISAEVGQPWSGMLKAYWPMTSATDLADASGNGHTLSVVGSLSNCASHPTIDAVFGRRKIAPVIFQ